MEDVLKPMSLSQTALANAIGVPPRRINEIVLGKRAITADTDLRLARYTWYVRRFLHRPANRLRTNAAQGRYQGEAEGNQAAGRLSFGPRTPHILNTPNFVSSTGAFSAAE